ncbi:glutamine synthetase family protein [Belnapia rosea]|uniref:glutamine synthetase family protein n=1 Tax=Belnapia rosea TaxID=938405 RepID=UPI00088698AD|nr:glutamine synthetase family protein [Belnapia rosea]SDB63281.1 glutamine synthetase [Belnapia rosea]
MRAAPRPVAMAAASPAANDTAGEDRFRRLLAAEGTDNLLVCMVDMQGRLVGKRLTARQARETPGEDMHACDYLLGVDTEMVPIPGLRSSGWERGFGDFSIRPDPATARLLPWQPGTLLVLGDTVDHEGHLVPHAPRSMLRRQLERLAAAGFTASMASELEFTVFQGDWQQLRAGSYRGLTPDGFYSEDYQVFQGTGREPLIRAIRNGMEAAGIPIESSKGEGGPGQAEITLLHAPALESADRHVIYKTGVKEMAQAAGKTASFMAKWHEAQPGSSGHIHLSLWGLGGESAMADAGGPHGFSAGFAHVLAGQIALLQEMTLFLAPVVNSYKRFQPGSFAPTKAVWSRDNRTAAFRVLGHGRSLRVECRVPGADVNPYLAYAALIAAGLHGLEQRLPLDPPAEGNAYLAEGLPEIPTTLREAMAALDRSTVLRAAFGDAVIDHYVRAAAWEQAEHDRRVTDWEIARYLERA